MKLRHHIVVYNGDAEMNHLSVLRQHFELTLAPSPESMRDLIAQKPATAALVHFPALTQQEIIWVEKLKKFSAWLPIIIFADRWDLDAVKQCGTLGIHAVLDCREEAEKKMTAIASALRLSGFRHLLAQTEKSMITWSLRMKRVYELILANFPNVPSVYELSASFHLHRRSFEKEFRKNFGVSYVCFVRLLSMYEAWRMMQCTELDNSEIALLMQYREETHFARDCRKAFDLNPTQLRELSENEFLQFFNKNFCAEK